MSLTLGKTYPIMNADYQSYSFYKILEIHDFKVKVLSDFGKAVSTKNKNDVMKNTRVAMTRIALQNYLDGEQLSSANIKSLHKIYPEYFL